MISGYQQCQILLNTTCKGIHSSLYICCLNAACVLPPASKAERQCYTFTTAHTRIWRLYSWECLLSSACLQSPGVCRNEGRCNRFFGNLASSRPRPDPISAWLRHHHPSASLLPLCGHTKTPFVLPLPALL